MIGAWSFDDRSKRAIHRARVALANVLSVAENTEYARHFLARKRSFQATRMLANFCTSARLFGDLYPDAERAAQPRKQLPDPAFTGTPEATNLDPDARDG